MDDRSVSLAVVRDLVAREPRADPDAVHEPDEEAAGPLPPRLRRLCRAAVRTLPADGATVSVLTDAGGLALTASSGSVAPSLAALEFTLGEGPGVDAVDTRRPVLVPDLANLPATRWPAFAPAAGALGVRAVFAFPLGIGAALLGALNVHRRGPVALDPRATGLALGFAHLAVETLLDGGTGDATDGGAAADDPPDDILDGHYVVYQAQGMTMVDLGVPLAEALVRLRAKAFADGRSLHDVARDVVDGRMRLEPDDVGPGRRPTAGTDDTTDDTRET